MSNNLQGWLKVIYVSFAFCSALFLGALKGLVVGPVASSILIIGNVGVILWLFPSHVAWTFYTLVKTNRFDTPLKVAIIFALPGLFGIWLGLSIAGSVLVGVGYGFFTPWVSTFEAFRHDNESKKFFHCLVDGTWGTVKGSCITVTDFADMCYHSFPVYLKELRECPHSNEPSNSKVILLFVRGNKWRKGLVYVPGCIIVGLIGLVVNIPLYTVIALVKSPYMLFKGWFRLLHDLISREGPFLETGLHPHCWFDNPFVANYCCWKHRSSHCLKHLYWIVWISNSIPGLERSFRKGIAYVIAMVAEFDEYTNDWLYLREGTILPKPHYRDKKTYHSSELSVGQNHVVDGKFNHVSMEAPAMLVPSLAHSRSVREAIQEVKMVQIWGNMMRSCEMRGRELLNANVITPLDLYESLKAKNGNEGAIISVGLPCYTFLQTLLYSIKAGSGGLLLLDNFEEQINVIKLGEDEVRYLEKVVLFGSNTQRMQAWDNGSLVPEDALRAAQIQGISRRMIGMVRSVSKFPTYRRTFRQIVKALIAYSLEGMDANLSNSNRSVVSIEIV
ncbi:hypothetical protein Pint_28073 [Pistacia integerrima]|uniref:Uncharacterized protein n=1 Tax=Pistacia integerrima TaxID=434235 RepID=A0ACC0YWL2_9ROSI|nr:hypothetical protein Pint_28073 [Pistacia integerrima]